MALKKKIAPRLEITQDDFPVRKISKRRMMPKLPKMSKAELRAMLAQVVKNTERK